MIGFWLELPVWAMLLVLVAVYGATAAAIFWFCHHSPARHWVAHYRGIVVGFFGAVSVLFALLYGFVAGDVWHRNADATRLVRAEADSLFALSEISAAAGSDAASLNALILAYAQSVVGEEWPLMVEGESSPRVEGALGKLLGTILGGDTQAVDPAVRRALVDTVLKLRALRSDRLALAGDTTDSLQWAALLILALLTQVAIASVQLEKPRPQAAALTIFTVAAVIAMGLVAVEERPFAPPAQVSTAPLDAVIKFIPAK